MSHLLDLQNLVLGRPAPGLDDALLWRISDALSRRGERGGAGPADIAALIRQALWRASLLEGGEPVLRVPASPGWPTAATWRDFHCSVELADAMHLIVRARSWSPSWLGQEAPEAARDVDDAIALRSRRPADRQRAADPVLTEVLPGYLSYTSPGQREAVRAAFLLPPGDTVLVNLPTGAGKTLAFQAPALRFADQGGLVVVIVPTVALARDQEERFLDLLRTSPGRPRIPARLAFHSGLTDEERGDMRRAIREGTLPILFTSPEAALGSLKHLLLDAASSGRLKLFAIDEAHMVSQWGEGFRPHFQMLAGLRRALFQACDASGHPRFRTLLLTATLTPSAYETLNALFGDGKRCHLVSETYLRPEAVYLLHQAPDEPARIHRVLDALRVLPRPLILYTTTRDHADAWHARLHQEQFLRTVVVKGGDLADPENEHLLRDWKERRLDIVVATSAFGLGMDLEEVRSVVHACVPETIDRYYQEVGRGGRDGNACVSLLVCTAEDFRTAENLSSDLRIGPERGLERWRSMFTQRGSGRTSGVHVLPLDAIPSGYTASSQRNESWNLRTLVLMARTGFIDFALAPPPEIQRVPEESDTQFETRLRAVLEKSSREVAVRIHDGRHSDQEAWDVLFQEVRRRLARADEEAFLLVRELGHLRRPLSELLRQVYAIPEADISLPPYALRCPVTRGHGYSADPPSFYDPTLLTLEETCARPSPQVARLFSEAREGGCLWVAYAPPSGDSATRWEWNQFLRDVLLRLATHGVTEFDLPESMADAALWKDLAAHSPWRFVCRADPPQEWGPLYEPPRARLSLLPPQASAVELRRVLQARNPVHILLLPQHTPDPERPDRTACAVRHSLDISQFMMRLDTWVSST
ncbi:protein DpdF [Corallococcus sp. bb12-1]|uniref:protein DpdF n=1 Tax=Corallococcus sp. bb12-1 TaxID=2996784 RepID=UPI00226FB69E|nr:protein DpdF [Corallococcus sp. bb12-1]MCY1045631.1 protein DpdF [Corallococcus sp. bb12-1]